jgi:hypothetical protein
VGDLVATSRVDCSFVDFAVDVSSTSDPVVCVVETGLLDVAVAVALAVVVRSSSSSSSVAVEKGLVATAGGTSVFGPSVGLLSAMVTHLTLPV